MLSARLGDPNVVVIHSISSSSVEIVRKLKNVESAHSEFEVKRMKILKLTKSGGRMLSLDKVACHAILAVRIRTRN